MVSLFGRGFDSLQLHHFFVHIVFAFSPKMVNFAAVVIQKFILLNNINKAFQVKLPIFAT